MFYPDDSVINLDLDVCRLSNICHHDEVEQEQDFVGVQLPLFDCNNASKISTF